MDETRKVLNIEDSNEQSERIIKLKPADIDNWEYRDRQEFELGDLDELANSIQLKGQAQPIVVVKASAIFNGKNSTNAKYIVIAGYRRWLACKLRNITVDAIIRSLSFEQAVACVVSENEKEAVSDYSKGKFYFELLKREGVSKKTLFEKLGLKRTMFNNYLSFAEVPQDIWQAVGDLSKVSARTSATIKLICQKGPAYHQAVKNIADKIASGAGEKTITQLVEKQVNQSERFNLVSPRATKVVLSKNIAVKYNLKGINIDIKGLSEAQHQQLQDRVIQAINSYLKQES